MTILESNFKSTKKGNKRAGQPKGARLAYDDLEPSGKSGTIRADSDSLLEEMLEDDDLRWADRMIDDLKEAQQSIREILAIQRKRDQKAEK